MKWLPRFVDGNLRLLVVLVTTASAVAGFSGCSEKAAKGRGRTKASGKVDFDGKPIPAGTVAFIHDESGNMAICKISNGTYASSSGEGPVPGKNTITVSGLDKVGGTPLWSGPWSKSVTITESGYSEVISVKSSEIPAPAKK